MTESLPIWVLSIGGLLEPEEAARRLSMNSREPLEEMVEGGRLICLTVEGEKRFPGFQFTGTGVLPGIAQCVAELRQADLGARSQALWFAEGNRLLQGLSPAAWLGRGRDSSVVAEAARAARHRLTG